MFAGGCIVRAVFSSIGLRRCFFAEAIEYLSKKSYEYEAFIFDGDGQGGCVVFLACIG